MRRLVLAVDPRKRRRQQAVARHREPDTRLAILKDHQRREHAHHGAHAHHLADLLEARGFQRWTTGAALPSCFQFIMPVSTSATET